MIVLLDLEWIDLDGKHLTQLSAIRTDHKWNTVSKLDLYVRPNDECLKMPKHVAFGGLSSDIFRNAGTEEECMLNFRHWMRSNDALWFWAKTNREYFTVLWEKYFPGRELPDMQVTSNPIREIAHRSHFDDSSPYRLLCRFGDKPQYPEHRSSNDVETMRRLFRRLEITPEDVRPAAGKKIIPQENRRETILEFIGRSRYNYVYLKGSSIFHRRNCKAILGTDSISNILGSVYYNTAAKDRRPCKLCKPTLQLFDEELIERDMVLEKQRRQGKLYEGGNEVSYYRLITGESIPLKRKKVVGWCQFVNHPGALTKELLQDHDCLGKNCLHLKRNTTSTYWAALEAERQAKEFRKEKAKAEKNRRVIDEADMKDLAAYWQSFLDDMKSDMLIVRVVRDTSYLYRIFYVSDSDTPDWNNYPEFQETLKFLHPHWRFILRHIRDEGGRLVTTEEYLRRAKK